MQTKIDALNSVVGENLTNIRVVKSFVREDFEREKFARSSEDVKKGFTRAEKILALNKSYRSTKEINSYALKLLPEEKRYEIFERTGDEVKETSGNIQDFKIDDYRNLKIYELCEGRLLMLLHTGDCRYDYSNPNRMLPILDK